MYVVCTKQESVVDVKSVAPLLDGIEPPSTFINGGALGESSLVEEVTIKDDSVTCKWIKIAEL